MSGFAELPLALGSWLERRARLTPQRRALTFEGQAWSYRDLLEQVDRLAAAFRSGGVNHGDRVAFLGLNHPAFLLSLFASARLGAVFVPLNFRLTGPELAYIVNDAGVHTLVADGQLQPLAEKIRGEVPVHRFVAAEPGADGWEGLGELLAGVPLAMPEPVTPDEVALIMYTSGTTGRPKGAMLTHGNLFWNNVNALHAMDIVADDVTLVCAPLFHIGGLNVTTLLTWQKGGEVVLIRSFDPGKVLELIARHRITTMFAVPAMLLFMSQHPDFATADLASVRLLICGGAPVPEPLIKLYGARGITFVQGYGLTETAPFALLLPADQTLAKVGSAGIPPLLSEVRLVDPEGRVVTEPMERGEICVRGPNVMKGYWNRPEATAEAIDAEGWFHSGDVGCFDAEGYFTILDRVKDMIITGGENVYPAEVETVLYDHPGIAEVAVIGLPDERWGEAVVAVAVPKEGQSLSLDELCNFAGERLARFKLPSRLELVEVLPRNPAGKVLKYELRQRFGRGE